MRGAQQIADPRGAFAFRGAPPNLFGGEERFSAGHFQGAPPSHLRAKKEGGSEDPPLRDRRHFYSCRRLDAEGAAAAASAFYVGIVELEAGAFDGFYVVDLNA